MSPTWPVRHNTGDLDVLCVIADSNRCGAKPHVGSRLLAKLNRFRSRMTSVSMTGMGTMVVSIVTVIGM